MYTRDVEDLPEKFVANGKCVFGTFKGHPERIDIRGVAAPYSSVFFLPKWITNLRIKVRMSYFFSVGNYIGCIDFFDAKIFGYSEVSFWDIKTKQRYVYRSVMGPRHRFIPHDLNVGLVVNRSKKRYFRLSWDKNADKMSATFNMMGHYPFSDVSAAFKAAFSDDATGEITCICPSPTTRRCSAHYMAVRSVHGMFSIKKKNHDLSIHESDGLSLFDMSRSYMKFMTSGEYVTIMGNVKGKNVVIRLQVTAQDSADSDTYNSNVIFVDGVSTPLPPVRITHTFGLMKTWNIQDTENMVDLSFTPVSDNPAYISALIVHTEYHTIYGTFEGTVATQDGQKISFKSLSGLAKKYRIRL